MLAIFFALISFLGWGIGDIFGTVATRKIGAYSTSFWSMVVGVVAFSIFIPYVSHNLNNFTFHILFLNIVLGIIFIIGLISFNEALRMSNPSLVGTISASFAALTVILSVIFLKESLSFLQIISIVAIFSGLLFSLKPQKKFSLKVKKGVFLALLTMITWGVYYTFIKIPVNQIGWFWPQYITLSLFPLLFFFMKARKYKLSKMYDKKIFLPLLANGVLVAIGEFSFNFGISRGLSSIVAPISGAYPVLFVILAFFLFKDKISKQQVFGIMVTLLGIVMLAKVSS